jgi:predicted GNAT superfamily acetyltransferase
MVEKRHGSYILFRVMKEVDVRIRRAEGLVDYQACIELQKEVWGFTQTEDLAALPMLMVGNRFGGNVLVAQDSSGRFIGFSFALPAWRPNGTRLWWSHMTAVVQEYRSKDIGLRLKLRQREEALLAGIEEIEWTFDPMQAVNANFNVHRLGAVVREYEENIYGTSSSALHLGLPTDRFVAEWHLQWEPVKERTEMKEGALILRDLDRIPRINVKDQSPNLALKESPLLLEIPVNLNQLKGVDLAGAKRWQDNIRRACQHYFSSGYTIVDFVMPEQPRSQALYVLEAGEGDMGTGKKG